MAYAGANEAISGSDNKVYVIELRMAASSVCSKTHKLADAGRTGRQAKRINGLVWPSCVDFEGRANRALIVCQRSVGHRRRRVPYRVSLAISFPRLEGVVRELADLSLSLSPHRLLLLVSSRAVFPSCCKAFYDFIRETGHGAMATYIHTSLLS
jgi:hypothetical protein